MPDRATPRRALTIAGSDSGGGAGAQADLKTFAAHRVHGTCALTAVTAQNTAEVRGVVALDPAFVRLQVETVLDDFDVRSRQDRHAGQRRHRGRGGGAGGRGAAAQPGGRPGAGVLDRARRLLEPDGVAAYLEPLLPRALVATPNLREAAVLGGVDLALLVESLEARVAVAEQLRHAGPRWVVVKGGHLTESADDVVAGPDGVTVLPGTRVATGNDHGTGCSLSAAMAADLASGSSVPEALATAKAFVARALAGGAGWRLGAGHGPLDHFGWSAAP